MNTNRSVRTGLVFALGLGCGLGINEGLRQPPGPAAGTPSPAERTKALPSPPPLIAAADAAVKEMDDVTVRILAKLGEPSISDTDKVGHIRALGRLGTPKAVDYLLANHTFWVFSPSGRRRFGLASDETPCIDALADIGIAAVPRLVEAYCTWPSEKHPESLLGAFVRQHPTLGGERSRAAYLLAQGYLFAYQDKHFNRDRTLELIYNLVPHAVDRETLFYPAPWMPNPGMPEAVIPEQPVKKP